MKILVITQTVDTENPVLGFFVDWIKEFSKHVEFETVICLKEGKHSLPQNVKVLSLGKEKSQSKIKYILKFYNYIWRERNNYDVVFVHMNQEYVLLGGILWKILRKKISLWYTHKYVGLRLRCAVILSNVVFSASKESFRLKTKKLIITGHGINTSVFKPDVHKNISNSNTIITIGRLSPVKDYETFIQGVEIIKKKISNIHAKIVGGPANTEDKKYVEILHTLIDRQNLHDSISFVGPIQHNDIVPLLQSSQMFVHMSETGSMDKAVLEAMATGVVVVSSSDAFRTILSPDNLVFEKKKPQDLANVLESIISNQKNIEQLSSKYREYIIKNHNLSKLISKIISVLYGTTSR